MLSSARGFKIHFFVGKKFIIVKMMVRVEIDQEKEIFKLLLDLCFEKSASRT